MWDRCITLSSTARAQFSLPRSSWLVDPSPVCVQSVKCSEDDQECLADPARALPLPVGEAYYQKTLNTSQEALEEGKADVVSGPLLGCAMLTWLAAYFALCAPMTASPAGLWCWSLRAAL